MKNTPPNIVVCVDTDCYLKPESIQQLAKKASKTGRTVQALPLLEMPINPNAKHIISTLAF